MGVKKNLVQQSSCLYLNQLKSEIKLRVLSNNNLWHDHGVQLRLQFYEGEPSDIDAIVELKNHFLLMDMYKLIFVNGHAYQDVHMLLSEIVNDLDLRKIFKPWIDDPGAMMVRCMDEFAKKSQELIHSEFQN